ncbi:MAG: glycoside hydrolase family 97 protein [Planctomycetes bacterium]|nr:glycoside hydrolase family 97 protein [Planctomycetota bacterium]
MQVTFRLDERGRPAFQVKRLDVLLLSGTLGLEFAGAGKLGEDLRVIGARREERDRTYAIPVGKASAARDRHRELIASLEERAAPHRKLDIAFRAFDDGIAFRYLLPQQDSLADFVLSDEDTRLTFTSNPSARFLRLSDFTTPYEAYYQTEKVWDIRPDVKPLIGLPILLEHPQGAWIAVTEADLTDYAGAYLVRPEAHPQSLKTVLSPLPVESAPQDAPPGAAKVVGRTPFKSPWRVLMIADDPGRLIESNVIFHLNEPSKIDDPSWIKPGKTTFPWWNHYVVEGVDFEPGVNTATMKHYIDFCAEQGIPYHSLDGLDIAWYGGPIHPRGPTDVTTAAPSIDMPELLRYAKEKGVRLRLWMHWKALQPQLDEAFAAYEAWGIEGVMIDFMDRDDQEMVRWYHEVAEKAARHHLTVTWHGAYKPTGMERTWPNVLSYEAVLNQEYNKWQPPGVKGTPPEHNLDAAFIRMLAGPLDYHQGGMRSVLPANYQFRDVAPPVQGTRGHQLAMYVVYQNHLPMMVDYPAAYRGQPGLEFLIDIPTTWDETRVLHADMGRCLVIARRKGTAWHLGGMTAGASCTLKLPLKFLGDGSFTAELFLDDPAGGPTALTRREQTLTATDSLQIEMPRSGGFVARLAPNRR